MHSGAQRPGSLLGSAAFTSQLGFALLCNREMLRSASQDCTRVSMYVGSTWITAPISSQEMLAMVRAVSHRF